MAHGHYERKAEFLLVRVVQRLEALELDLRALIEPGAGLLFARLRRQFAGHLQFSGEVRVGANQCELPLGRGIVHAVCHELGKALGVLEARRDGGDLFGDPG